MARTRLRSRDKAEDEFVQIKTLISSPEGWGGGGGWPIDSYEND